MGNSTEQIEALYEQKDRQAVELMNGRLTNYSELLEHGGKVLDDRKGKVVYTLLAIERGGTVRICER